jgi:hypothetical protein
MFSQQGLLYLDSEVAPNSPTFHTARPLWASLKLMMVCENHLDGYLMCQKNKKSGAEPT